MATRKRVWYYVIYKPEYQAGDRLGVAVVATRMEEESSYYKFFDDFDDSEHPRLMVLRDRVAEIQTHPWKEK